MSIVSFQKWGVASRRWDRGPVTRSPGLLAPDPRGGAIGTAALPSDDALIVDLSRQDASTVPHYQSTLRAHCPLPEIWRGPDDAARYRQRKRNAVFPTSDVIARAA